MAIGKIECTCRKCGEKFTVRREFHSRREADEWEASCQSEYDLCDDCRRKAQVKAAAKANKANEMPHLSGSSKQIAWAEQIRAKAVAEFLEYVGTFEENFPDGTEEERAAYDRDYAACMDYIRSMVEASQWIDIRHEEFVDWVCKQALGE